MLLLGPSLAGVVVVDAAPLTPAVVVASLIQDVVVEASLLDNNLGPILVSVKPAGHRDTLPEIALLSVLPPLACRVSNSGPRLN